LPRIAWHYKRGSARLPYGPMRLWVEPTSFCNLKCPMCTSKDIPEEKVGYMDFGLYRKIIDEAKGVVQDINLFLGGESLFHKELPEMIRYAKAAGIGTRLSTNATTLTKEKTAALLDAGLDFILFSFDGFEKEVYEKIRVNANFEKTLDYITAFLREKARRGSRKPYVVFQVIEFTDLTGRGKDREREAFLQRLEGLPIDKFSFIQPHSFGGKIDREEEKGFRAMTRRYVPCTFLWYSMTVRWDGTVVPCCVDLAGEMPVADLRKESLLSVWNGPVLTDLREKIASRRHLEVPLCSGCDILWKEQVFGVPVKSLKELRYFFTGAC
ncbi:MAG: radical SAM protein, partial [Nitrospirae bacterium]|nr:radical SAM protein [Nitrospirota bacterium]